MHQLLGLEDQTQDCAEEVFASSCKCGLVASHVVGLQQIMIFQALGGHHCASGFRLQHRLLSWPVNKLQLL